MKKEIALIDLEFNLLENFNSSNCFHDTKSNITKFTYEKKGFYKAFKEYLNLKYENRREKDKKLKTFSNFKLLFSKNSLKI